MVADGPPLEVPAPPPRVIGQIDDTLTGERVPLGPPDPQGVASAPAAAPANPKPRSTTPRTDTEGREAAPAPAAAPATPPAPPVTDTARELRASGDAEAANRVSGLLQRARTDLNRIDPRKLSAENKKDYDEATRFVQRAEEEVKVRNFIFAETFADKAATLAAQLVGR